MEKESIHISNEDGVKLKIIRNNMGLSAAEFSEKTEINPSYLNLIEKGCMPLPARYKRKIQEVFGLQENWFDVIDLNQEENNIHQNTYSVMEQQKEDAKSQISIQNFVINNGDVLKSVRVASGLSRKELAEAIGISSVQIGYIETGKRKLTEKVKNKLNDYLRVYSIIPQNIFTDSGEITGNTLNNIDRNSKIPGYNISNDEILNKISMIKKRKRYTQTIVSEKSGVNRSQLSMIENGKMQISKKVKEKLLHFIHSESEDINCNVENTSILMSTEQEKSKDYMTDIVINKSELIKMIASLKETRDEINKNIKMLKSVIRNI